MGAAGANQGSTEIANIAAYGEPLASNDKESLAQDYTNLRTASINTAPARFRSCVIRQTGIPC